MRMRYATCLVLELSAFYPKNPVLYQQAAGLLNDAALRSGWPGWRYNRVIQCDLGCINGRRHRIAGGRGYLRHCDVIGLMSDEH